MNEKVALITGASSGIGRATALAFAAKGASVVLAARRQDELDSLVREIEAGGGKATAIKTDVSKAQDVAQTLSRPLDILTTPDSETKSRRLHGSIGRLRIAVRYWLISERNFHSLRFITTRDLRIC